MTTDDAFTASPDAAVAHYRNLSETLQRQLDDANTEMHDFMESSKELQDELEKELSRMEASEKDMRTGLEQARGEVEDWKSKYTTTLRDHTSTMTHMQKELDSLRQSEKSLRTRVRDMELDNDDLEKAEREKDSSLQDLESRYGRAIERIALLEEELVAKAQLEEEVQRLRDELRDVQEELAVVKAKAPAPAQHDVLQTPAADGSNRHSNSLPSPDSPTRAESPTPTLSAAAAASKTARRSPPPAQERSPIPPVPTLHHSATPDPGPLSRSTKTRNLATSSTTPNAVRATRTNTMINDMKHMTDRVKKLTSRLDSRRNLVMAGSAIPRASMSPGGAASLARSTTSRRLANSSLGKSVGPGATGSSFNGSVRPPSRASSRAASEADHVVVSTRPPSRSAMRMSMAGPPKTTLSARPPSRMSSASGSRPQTPSMPVNGRSPTPSSSRPAWNSSFSSASTTTPSNRSTLSQSTRVASTSLASSTRTRRVSAAFGSSVSRGPSLSNGSTKGTSESPPPPLPTHNHVSSIRPASKTEGAFAGLGVSQAARRPPAAAPRDAPSTPGATASNGRRVSGIPTPARRASVGPGLGRSTRGLI